MRGQSSTEYLANFAIVLVIILGTVYALNHLGIASITSAIHERTQKVAAKVETIGVDNWKLQQDGTFFVSLINNGDVPLNITYLQVETDLLPKDSMNDNPTTTFCGTDGENVTFYEVSDELLYPNARLTVYAKFDACAYANMPCEVDCDQDLPLAAPYKLRTDVRFFDPAGIEHSVYKVVDGRVEQTLIV